MCKGTPSFWKLSLRLKSPGRRNFFLERWRTSTASMMGNLHFAGIDSDSAPLPSLCDWHMLRPGTWEVPMVKPVQVDGRDCRCRQVENVLNWVRLASAFVLYHLHHAHTSRASRFCGQSLLAGSYNRLLSE